LFGIFVFLIIRIGFEFRILSFEFFLAFPSLGGLCAFARDIPASGCGSAALGAS
jgi:hypothetical protein